MEKKLGRYEAAVMSALEVVYKDAKAAVMDEDSAYALYEEARHADRMMNEQVDRARLLAEVFIDYAKRLEKGQVVSTPPTRRDDLIAIGEQAARIEGKVETLIAMVRGVLGQKALGAFMAITKLWKEAA